MVLLSDLLHAYGLVFMSGLRNIFREWKGAFESKGLRVSCEKTNVMGSGCIAKDRVSNCTHCTYGIYGLRVKVSSVMCLKCCKSIHSTCAGVKRVIP